MLWTADRGGNTGLLSFLVSLSALRHPEDTGRGPQRFVTLWTAVCYITQKWHGHPVEIKEEARPGAGAGSPGRVRHEVGHEGRDM